MLELVRSDFKTEWKGDKSPVTLVDKELEEMFRIEVRSLLALFDTINDQAGWRNGRVLFGNGRDSYPVAYIPPSLIDISESNNAYIHTENINLAVLLQDGPVVWLDYGCGKGLALADAANCHATNLAHNSLTLFGAE